jgi:hypothetical protein
MTCDELQSRTVRRSEVHYDRLLAAYGRKASSPSKPTSWPLRKLGASSEALEELRRRGLFPFPEGEIPAHRLRKGASRA